MIRRFARLLSLAVVLVLPATAQAAHTQVSTFQDDEYLIDSPTPVVAHNLQILEALGVQVIRVNLQWDTVAPDPLSRTEPAGFDAADPSAYPASGWAPYDRLVSLAPVYGMQVQFNLTAPGPLWAMGAHPPTTRSANHWEPSPKQFFDFVYAVGERYRGAPYGQPRVTQWSIWNEPDQPGWLAPQSLRIRGVAVPQSPRLYRRLADAAYYGLYFSGHGPDTILIGETAPEGKETPGFYTPLTPLPFLRGVYCVDPGLHPLRGPAAKRLGCPMTGTTADFVRGNEGLFRATGFAHHPYYFTHPPGYSAPDQNFLPIANLGRLERFLDGTFRTYGIHRRLPIYFTEYGYQTRPPDPYQVVSTAEQAAYLNQADYLAWRDPRVKSVAQFLLYDAAADPRYAPNQFKYWDTFQTGLLFTSGAPKPALFAYRMPIWIPSPAARLGSSTFVWGQVRPADRLGAQTVSILWRPTGNGGYREIGRARTQPGTGYLTATVRLPGTGFVKLAWRASGSLSLRSRPVPVTVR